MSVLLAKTLRSRTFKLALAAIAVFGAIVIVLLAYVYWSTASYARSLADRANVAEIANLQKIYRNAGRSGLIAAIPQRIAESRLEGGVYLLAAPSFAPLAGNLAGWPPDMKAARGCGDFTPAGSRTPLRVAFETLPDGSHLLAGSNIGGLEQFALKIKIALALGVLLIFALAGMASVLVTKRTVGRIEAINAASRAIMKSGLGERIPLRGSHDEWDELAGNLNSMLDRIEALMREVKQVSDNVAHDLRTPLARIRGRLEMACGKQGQENHSLLAGIMADLDAVLRMFSSLLRISQIEALDWTNAFRSISLVEIANDVAELFDAAAEEKGGHIVAKGDAGVSVKGDRDLLFEAVANLADNAVKHGRPGGQVTIEVGHCKGGAVISVADGGPGIPCSEYQHVFKRFYRLERSRSTPGNGLGLSLVAAVARLHGAKIEMADNKPGLRVKLRFPSLAAPRF